MKEEEYKKLLASKDVNELIDGVVVLKVELEEIGDRGASGRGKEIRKRVDELTKAIDVLGRKKKETERYKRWRDEQLEKKPEAYRQYQREINKRSREIRKAKDPEGFKRKEAEARKRYKAKDPETYIKRMREAVEKYNKKQQEKDSDGFRRKRIEASARSKSKRLEKDPEGFRRKHREVCKEWCQRQLEKNPIGFREKQRQANKRHHEKQVTNAERKLKSKPSEMYKRWSKDKEIINSKRWEDWLKEMKEWKAKKISKDDIREDIEKLLLEGPINNATISEAEMDELLKYLGEK